jgi:DtxR family transcriptional regulator, Mn-dependent transcriptional regulator
MVSASKAQSNEKTLTPVMEDYLEAIFTLDQENTVVRVKDIAQRMDVKMPTVSSMLKTLNNRGLVDYEKYEYVRLTRSGADVGKEMRRRHKVLLTFLTNILNIDHADADNEACKMEHVLGADTLDSLTDFMDFIQSCPRTGENWLNYFREYRQYGRVPSKCKARSGGFACEFQDRINTD